MMVKAILAGRKTQTRRFVRLASLEPSRSQPWDWELTERNGDITCYTTAQLVAAKCPFGVPGERLWVRETWTHDASDVETCRAAHEDAAPGLNYGPYYLATEVAPDTLTWRPSIFMPRWASRITLEVTEVRVQRLQEISEDDARAEGIPSSKGYDVPGAGLKWFSVTWDKINGRRVPWSSNPWVWALTFKRAQ